MLWILCFFAPVNFTSRDKQIKELYIYVFYIKKVSLCCKTCLYGIIGMAKKQISELKSIEETADIWKALTPDQAEYLKNKQNMEK